MDKAILSYPTEGDGILKSFIYSKSTYKTLQVPSIMFLQLAGDRVLCLAFMKPITVNPGKHLAYRAWAYSKHTINLLLSS